MSSSTPKIPQKARKAKARAEPVAPISSTRKSKPTPSTSDRKIPTKSSATTDKDKKPPTANDNTLFRVNFEVRGKVQGVHFRKYTQLKGTSFGLRGWCQNTSYSTVIGCMEGPRIKLEQMKQWLKSTGSPKSVISGAEFREIQCDAYTLIPGFQIVK